MNIIVHSKHLKGSGHLTLCHRRAVVTLLAVFLVMPAALLYGGYRIGEMVTLKNPDEITRAWQEKVAQQEREIEEARQTAQENVNALAMKLGEMQAQMIRLNALGERLTKMANLDEGEFDFDSLPAQGGPEGSEDFEPIETPDFVQALDRLSSQLEDRSRQLSVLESMMMNRNLQAEVLPAGRPIKRGWTSSFYGMRTDPFNGRREFHKGMDFAGREGSDVVATASGVVTWAGARYGYGNLVEINHGNGYVTRYGHNKEVLVEVGDTVKKGDRVGLMGSTGRSTGPHVHFEVWNNGRTVNPEKYIQQARR